MLHEHRVIAGYIAPDGHVFCIECWRAHAEAGARPFEVLQSEKPDEPFWIVDQCAGCGLGMKYKDVMALN